MKQFKPGDIAIWKPGNERSMKGPTSPTDVVIKHGPNTYGEYHVQKVSRYGGKMRVQKVKYKYLEAKE